MLLIQQYGWVPCGDDMTRGFWRNSEYPNVQLMPAQILKFHSDDAYKNNVLTGVAIMDVFFNQIFRDLP